MVYLTLTNIYSNPLKHQEECLKKKRLEEVNHGLDLYYKYGFLHIYKQVRRYLVNLLGQRLPESVCLYLINYLYIDKYDYLPKKSSISMTFDTYSRQFQMVRWIDDINIKLNVLMVNGDGDGETKNDLITELYLEGSFHHLTYLVITLTKFYENRQNKAKLDKSPKICQLVDVLDNYTTVQHQAFIPQSLNDSTTANDKTYTYLPWYQYRDIHNRQKERENYQKIYYDLIDLYLYLNYFLQL